jgi:hypothetical protein
VEGAGRLFELTICMYAVIRLQEVQDCVAHVSSGSVHGLGFSETHGGIGQPRRTTDPGLEMTMNSRSLSMWRILTGSLATGGSWRCTVFLRVSHDGQYRFRDRREAQHSLEPVPTFQHIQRTRNHAVDPRDARLKRVSLESQTDSS